MRQFLIIISVLVVLLIALGTYGRIVQERIDEVIEQLEADYQSELTQLRALDQGRPAVAPARLDDPRFELYLNVRTAVSAYVRSRIDEPHANVGLDARRTRNQTLATLREALKTNKMGFAEYRAFAQRWRALLAAGGPKELRQAWDGQVRTPEHRDGLPLPAPAKDATAAERTAFNKHTERLRETMIADLLHSHLEKVEAPQ